VKHVFLAAAAISTALQLAASGAEPPLAAAVPSDVGLCLEIRDLGSAVERSRSGPWLPRIASFPPVAAWAGANRPRLVQLARQAAGQFDLEPQDFVQQVFGQEVVIAIWPGEVGRSEPGPGAVLVRAADSELLSRIVGRLVSLERRGDASRVREAVHAGRQYYVQQRERPQPGVELCLAAVGNVGIITNREALMRQVLELLAGDAPVESSLAGRSAYQSGIGRLAPQAVVRAFVQPRPWDALLAAGLASTSTGPPQRRQLLLDTWQAAEYWVTGVEVSDRIALESYLQLAPERLPAAWQRLIDRHTGNTAFLEHVPSDALIAIAGRADIARWLRTAFAGARRPEVPDLHELRRMVRLLFLGWDPVDRVIAGLGPDWGAYLTANEERSASIEWVLGVALQPPTANSPVPSVSEILDGGLRAALTVAAAVYNARQGELVVRVETNQIDGGMIRSIDGFPEWPAQLPRASLCLPELLLAGSSISAVLRSAETPAADSLAAHSRLRHALGPRAAEPSDVVYVNMRGLREWLLAHSDVAAAWIASQKGLSSAAARQEVERLVRLLELADTTVAAVALAEDGLALIVAACVETDHESRQ
jgi:hypothetical protein